MDSEADYLQDLVREADELLELYLTQGDYSEVSSTYKDLSKQVRWGKVVEHLFAQLLDNAYDLVFGLGKLGESQYTKNDTWYLASDSEMALYDDHNSKGGHRRHLLLLLVVQKMLRVLKAKAGQSFKNLPLLTDEEEYELRQLKEAAEEATSNGEEMDSDEQETELLARLERGESADLSLEGPCINGGRHARTVMRHRRRNDQVYFEQYCRDCRKVISVVEYTKGQRHTRPCTCSTATWVPGREGQEAVCSNPQCGKPIANPETFHWEEAGLEPYGDDPSQDEVTTLCSDY